MFLLISSFLIFLFLFLFSLFFLADLFNYCLTTVRILGTDGKIGRAFHIWRNLRSLDFGFSDDDDDTRGIPKKA